MTKWPVQKPTHRTTQKHVEHQDATDIQNKLFFVFFSPSPWKLEEDEGEGLLKKLQSTRAVQYIMRLCS